MRKEEARHRREVEACFEEADAIEHQEAAQYGDTRLEELPGGCAPLADPRAFYA